MCVARWLLLFVVCFVSLLVVDCSLLSVGCRTLCFVGCGAVVGYALCMCVRC